jgi:hypothetical protein
VVQVLEFPAEWCVWVEVTSVDVCLIGLVGTSAYVTVCHSSSDFVHSTLLSRGVRCMGTTHVRRPRRRPRRHHPLRQPETRQRRDRRLQEHHKRLLLRHPRRLRRGCLWNNRHPNNPRPKQCLWFLQRTCFLLFVTNGTKRCWYVLRHGAAGVSHIFLLNRRL